MTINDMKRVLDADIRCCEDMLHNEVTDAYSSDLMSEVLAQATDQSVLLSGLNNPQLIRTAEMMDITCVILLRGKQPSEEMIDLAKDRGICVLVTQHEMFTACGILYEQGLRGGGEG